ncbi:MAG: hypothetical protein JZU65_21515, partial [Chlorobium sp.]|nr:hypothetical protein [Chlorobium sp.]
MNTYQEQSQTDEIDLRKLFETLWKNKHLIFTITAFFTIAGVAYAFLAPQEWCAKATVAIPSTTKVEKLQRKIEDLIVLSKNGVNNPISTSYYNNFIDSFTETKLLTDFAQAFNSFDNKIEFLKSNNYIRQDGMDERARLRSLEKTTKKIAAHQKKNETFFTLTFVADNAKNASKRLSEYLEFIQAKEVEIKNQLLADKIANQINALTLNFQAQKIETLKRLQEDIT